MSPLVTILLYVVIPLGVYLGVVALARRPRSGSARWRSGSPWDHEPTWWMGNPKGTGVPAPPSATDPTAHTARGGARGTW